jgi:hypothetical protein
LRSEAEILRHLEDLEEELSLYNDDGDEASAEDCAEFIDVVVR